MQDTDLKVGDIVKMKWGEVGIIIYVGRNFTTYKCIRVGKRSLKSFGETVTIPTTVTIYDKMSVEEALSLGI